MAYQIHSLMRAVGLRGQLTLIEKRKPVDSASFSRVFWGVAGSKIRSVSI
ncbi:hypothetical protein CCACVL1_08021 [Corchorus capsularis]|uniref:Uncharacterized protein n=1 Tax=Corchorus capsularis TaxID=210143 RepID=A0A1R3J2Q7_COCAP|nr:hypothetical protein CCACVL1_08021 [Corchorus capsularis]